MTWKLPPWSKSGEFKAISSSLTRYGFKSRTWSWSISLLFVEMKLEVCSWGKLCLAFLDALHKMVNLKCHKNLAYISRKLLIIKSINYYLLNWHLEQHHKRKMLLKVTSGGIKTKACCQVVSNCPASSATVEVSFSRFSSIQTKIEESWLLKLLPVVSSIMANLLLNSSCIWFSDHICSNNNNDTIKNLIANLFLNSLSIELRAASEMERESKRRKENGVTLAPMGAWG